MDGGAEFDHANNLRWRLWRRWRRGTNGMAYWIMLNPSTATADQDDPTTSRIYKFCRRQGFNGYTIYNLLPYITPDPQEAVEWYMDQDETEREQLMQSLFDLLAAEQDPSESCLIAAWGKVPPEFEPIRVEVLDYWIGSGGRFKCIGENQDGSPRHPMARGSHRVPVGTPFVNWTPN